MFTRIAIILQFLLAFSLAAQAATYSETTLYSFVTQSDGENPYGTPVIDSAGDLYSVTQRGGGSCDCGTVFKLDPSGNETVLHTFDNTDGATPIGSLTMDTAGNLYGTTTAGGLTSQLAPQGQGVVFKITPSGDFSVLYEFGSAPSDGIYPDGRLTINKGVLYGTTAFGGGNCKPDGADGCGTVFKVNSSGEETVLYRFTGLADGWEPFANVTPDSAGNLYGTASSGGADNWGVLFKLSPQNKLTVIHSFCSETNCADGGDPRDIIRTAEGTIYGATVGGGPSGRGVAFKFNASGVETVLHTFCPNGPPGCPDGEVPILRTLSGSTLYGATSLGGNKYGGGTVFALTTSGSFSVIFDLGNIGQNLDVDGLAIDSAGNLFGDALNGGEAFGTVFELTKK